MLFSDNPKIKFNRQIVDDLTKKQTFNTFLVFIEKEKSIKTENQE